MVHRNVCLVFFCFINGLGIIYSFCFHSDPHSVASLLVQQLLSHLIRSWETTWWVMEEEEEEGRGLPSRTSSVMTSLFCCSFLFTSSQSRYYCQADHTFFSGRIGHCPIYFIHSFVWTSTIIEVCSSAII